MDQAGLLGLGGFCPFVVGQQVVQVLAGFAAGAATALCAAVQRLGLEYALAQGVVGVFGGGGAFALAGAGALQAAFAVVAV